MRIPYHIRDKRVIPRLCWVPYFIQIFLIGLVAAAMLAGFRLTLDGRLLLGSAVAENTIIIGTCAAAYLLPVFGLPRIFAWLGVLTCKQREDFSPFSKEWPESWLEPIPGDANNTHSKDM